MNKELIEKCRHTFHDNAGYNNDEKWQAVINLILDKVKDGTNNPVYKMFDDVGVPYIEIADLEIIIDNLRWE